MDFSFGLYLTEMVFPCLILCHRCEEIFNSRVELLARSSLDDDLRPNPVPLVPWVPEGTLCWILLVSMQ